MHRIFPIITILIALSYQSYSQKQANIWYFGDSAGIDFNSGVAVPISDAPHRIEEACASICDTSGNLLFYTNGSVVWNAQHDTMPNGKGLRGNFSSRQTLIIQDICDLSRYYIFSVDGETGSASYNYDSMMYYSIVDMDINGGLGDVIIKNISLFGPVNEVVAGIKHGNGINTWVVTHEFNTNRFIAYEISKDGISAPVISTVGSSQKRQSSIKFSPKGNMLAFGTGSFGPTEIFKFDNNTGIVSDPLNLNNNYGTSYIFSPSGNILYVLSKIGISLNYNLIQYDLQAGSNAAILASATTIAGPLVGYALQNAPDGKIYCHTTPASSLSVIQNPNALGVACDFQLNTFDLAGGEFIAAFPNFMQSYFDPDFEQYVPAIIESYTVDTSMCEDDMLTLTFPISNGITYRWLDASANDSTLVVDDSGTFLLEASDPCSIDTIYYHVSINNCDTQFFIPNGFTPQADGTNDFFPPLTNTIDYEFIIYDRLGNEVFKGDQLNSWDGTYHNKLCEAGIYTYRLMTETENYSGNVFLIR